MSARIELTKLPARYQAQAVAQLGQKKAVPDLTGLAGHVAAAIIEGEAGVKGKKRLRQNSKPLQNSNELAFELHLREMLPSAFIHPQSVTLGLANGVRYTPDFMSYEAFNGRLCFWEVKGPRKIFDGAGEKLKIAANKYREFIFLLVWREAGEWQRQRIKA